MFCMSVMFLRFRLFVFFTNRKAYFYITLNERAKCDIPFFFAGEGEEDVMSKILEKDDDDDDEKEMKFTRKSSMATKRSHESEQSEVEFPSSEDEMSDDALTASNKVAKKAQKAPKKAPKKAAKESAKKVRRNNLPGKKPPGNRLKKKLRTEEEIEDERVNNEEFDKMLNERKRTMSSSDDNEEKDEEVAPEVKKAKKRRMY